MLLEFAVNISENTDFHYICGNKTKFYLRKMHMLMLIK